MNLFAYMFTSLHMLCCTHYLTVQVKPQQTIREAFGTADGAA